MSTRSASPSSSPLRELVASGQLAGYVAIHVQAAGTLHLESSGARDLHSGAPMSADTVFRLHSMSKALTTTGLLALCDDGLCSLDTPLSKILPELAQLSEASAAAPKTPLTLHHLITHTAGLPYPNPHGNQGERDLAAVVGDMMSEPQADSLAEWTIRLSGARLTHAPGQGFSYGISIDVLGRVLEVLSGLPLDSYLRARLFDPLGMCDTGFALRAHQRARLAKIYRVTPSGLEEIPASAEAPRFLSGGGGLFSTVRDYARFCRMLLGGGTLEGARVLHPRTVEAITTCQLGAVRARPDVHNHRDLGPGTSFGLLGRVVCEPEVAGYGSRGTFGWDGVCGNHFFVDRERDLAGVLLTQILPWPTNLHRDFRNWSYAMHADGCR